MIIIIIGFQFTINPNPHGRFDCCI